MNSAMNSVRLYRFLRNGSFLFFFFFFFFFDSFDAKIENEEAHFSRKILISPKRSKMAIIGPKINIFELIS